MIGWLRLLLMIFYAPLRGLRGARDRGSLLPIAFLTFLSQVAYGLVVNQFAGAGGWRTPGSIWSEGFRSAMFVVLIAVIFVPVLTLVSNLFDHRGSFRVVLTQEYSSLAGAMLYAFTATNLIGIIIAAFFHFTGFQANHIAATLQQADTFRSWFPASPEVHQQLTDPVAISLNLFRFPRMLVLTIGMILCVKEVFRLSFWKSIAICVVSVFVVSITRPFWNWLFMHIVGAPFLLFLVFMLLRGYFSEFMSQQRAKASFKQNLEASTLNPADASAHYNLGLIHQNRGDFNEAIKSFERAVEIDAEEIDASYQLGRIARSQKRFADAIQHFEKVVSRNPSHSQYEVWREVAATYIAAGQYEDARNALEQFLEHRPSDPEGLYLMGCAHAGLGHKREAASLMRECIEAVKTAPAYKYRTSKRWMNEAQQFIKNEQ